MANKKLNLSKEGKELLEEVKDSLDLERALVLKVALAKGISSEEEFKFDMTSSPKWTIPDNIIKDNEFLMFKHLIISKNSTSFEDNELQNKILFYIEKGVRVLNNELNEKNSLEDSRLVILNN